MDFYRNLTEETFDENSCFLCGHECESKTAEHIFPKWLQHKYNLWNQKLIITNGTLIPYRLLTVPCCSKCNNEHLSQLEDRFKLLLDKSFENLSFEEETTIFQWSAKILYATRYKELSLKINRANPDLGKILTPKELESYSALHLFLQSIRYETEFTPPKPWSLFIFSCRDKDFFYHNNIPGLCFSMKFGRISITIVYEDNNCIAEFMRPLESLKNYELNFHQYLEVNAHIFYSAILKDNVPKYFSSFSMNVERLIINTAGSLRSREWVNEEFAGLFDFLLNSCGINMGGSVLQDGLITSFLVDNNGEHLLKKYLGN